MIPLGTVLKPAIVKGHAPWREQMASSSSTTTSSSSSSSFTTAPPPLPPLFDSTAVRVSTTKRTTGTDETGTPSYNPNEIFGCLQKISESLDVAERKHGKTVLQGGSVPSLKKI